MYYIATFFSHFGAIRFARKCRKEGHGARLMPVPRSISSSCGTCVQFEASADYMPEEDIHGELQQVVRETEEGYEAIYRGE